MFFRSTWKIIRSTAIWQTRADDFIESIGINGSPIITKNYENGQFKDAGKSYDPQVFTDLGIRYYRQPLKYDLTRDDQPQQVFEAYRKSGARMMTLLEAVESMPRAGLAPPSNRKAKREPDWKEAQAPLSAMVNGE